MNFKEFKEFLNSDKLLNEIEILNKIDCLDFISNQARNRFLNNSLYIKQGNKKIGKDTTILSLSSCHNCISKKNNTCKVCNKGFKCYGLSLEQYKKNTLINNVFNELLFPRLKTREIIEQILENSNLKTRFIRFNEYGEIKHRNIYRKLQKISKKMYKDFNIKSYTYSNQFNNINIKNNDYFNIVNSQKINYINDLHDLKNIDNYILCLGNCSSCNICKNKYIIDFLQENDYKLIFFVHGQGKSLDNYLKRNPNFKGIVNKNRDLQLKLSLRDY